MVSQENKEQAESLQSNGSAVAAKHGKSGTRLTPPSYGSFSSAVEEEEQGELHAVEQAFLMDSPIPPNEQNAKGSLPAALQLEMQQHFNFDLSSINIHENSLEASSHSAKAFAKGNDIFFAQGMYDPSSSNGQQLIAHELTHVQQNQNGSVESNTTNNGVDANADPSLENEAQQTAKKISPVNLQNVSFQQVSQFLQSQVQKYPKSNANSSGPAQFDIDLGALDIGRKISIIRMIADISWMESLLTNIDMDAHPKHKEQYTEALWSVIQSRYTRLITLATRTVVALSSADLTNIESEYATFISTEAPAIDQELKLVHQAYKTIEMIWLYSFLAAGTLIKDPTNLNDSGKSAKLEFKPGNPGVVTIITRVQYNFQRTPEAVAASVDDWTDEEKDAFRGRFQEQLDDVWDTNSVESFAPFRITEPQDFLLKDEGMKWSDITAHMKAKAEEVTGSGTVDFTLNVFKTDGTQSPRASVSGDDVSATFYDFNADRSYNSDGTENGRQHTLAHEWMHMIGQPDEYAENSRSQSQDWIDEGSNDGEGLGSDQWQTCQDTLTDRSTDASLTQEERDLAAQHLDDLRNQYRDSDPSTPGNQRRIYNTAGQDNIPDECFAVRGRWSGPQSNRLRPGGNSRRGGTTISQNVEDSMRISHGGNRVHAYHREGILVELNSLLETRDPKVRFEHNFQDLGSDSQLEVFQARLNNIHWDIIELQESISGSSPHEEVHDNHDHSSHQ